MNFITFENLIFLLALECRAQHTGDTLIIIEVWGKWANGKLGMVYLGELYRRLWIVFKPEIIQVRLSRLCLSYTMSLYHLPRYAEYCEASGPGFDVRNFVTYNIL